MSSGPTSLDALITAYLYRCALMDTPMSQKARSPKLEGYVERVMQRADDAFRRVDAVV